MPLAYFKNIPEGLLVNQFYRKTMILPLSVAGAVLALFLIPNSRDFSNYEIIFENAKKAQNLIDSFSATEPIFTGLSYLTSNIYLSIFLLVCLGLIIKLQYFASLGEAAWITATIYFAHFYVVHEVTQIRASFAIALLLYGFMLLEKRRYRLASIVLILSTLSHISTLVYIPIIFFIALVRYPIFALRWAIVVLLGMVLYRLLGYAMPDLAAWDIDSNLYAATRFSNYLYNEELYDVKGFENEMFFYFKLLVLIVIAFFRNTTQLKYSQNVLNDWPIRAGLMVTFASMFYVLFYDNFTIGARLADLAAPFECAVLAYFIFHVTTPFGAKAAVLLRIVLTLVLVLELLIPQLNLIDIQLEPIF